jgi:hypothetical protein
LDNTIENQDVAIVGRLENKDILVQGLFNVKNFFDLDGHSYYENKPEVSFVLWFDPN